MKKIDDGALEIVVGEGGDEAEFRAAAADALEKHAKELGVSIDEAVVVGIMLGLVHVALHNLGREAIANLIRGNLMGYRELFIRRYAAQYGPVIDAEPVGPIQ
jgi:hypothetical protein